MIKAHKSLFLAFCLFAFAAVAQQSAPPTLMQQVFMAKRLLPGIKTIGVLCQTTHAANDLKLLQIACNAYGVQLKIFHTASLQELRERFEQMLSSEKVDLVWVLPDDVTDQRFGRRFLSERCIAAKIPLYVHSLDALREGALFSVSNDQSGAAKIYFNKKVGSLINAAVPADAEPVTILLE